MNKTFRSLLGAAVCVAAATPVVAQAQTWASWSLPAVCPVNNVIVSLGSNTAMLTTDGGGLFSGVLASNGAGCGGMAGFSTTAPNPPYNFWSPSAPYGANGPNTPGLAQFIGPVRTTITFSTAVVNPLLAFNSLGNLTQPNAVTLTFSDAFQLLSDNTTAGGAWGTGTNSIVGNTLTGNEFSGLLRFNGTFTSLTFESSGTENWSAFTVGYESEVPEPSTVGLVLTGLFALGVTARRRQRQGLSQS